MGFKKYLIHVKTKHDQLLLTVTSSFLTLWGTYLYSRYSSLVDIKQIPLSLVVHSFVFLMIAALFFCFFVYIPKEDQKNESELKSALIDAQQAVTHIREENLENVKKIIANFLALLSRRVGLGVNDRVTLYLHSHRKSAFYFAGRYSDNTKFTEKHRNMIYDNQGNLNVAWHSQDDIVGKPINDIPSDERDYFSYCVEQNIPKRDISKFNMRAVSMLPIILKEEGGFDKIGICLLESVAENKFTEEDVEIWADIIKEYGAYVHCLLKAYKKAYNDSRLDNEENEL